MRSLSPFEKKLVERINNGNGDFLPNLLEPFIKGAFINVDKRNQSATIFVETYNINENMEQKIIVNCVSKIVITSVNLLNLLESDGYVFTFKFADFKPNVNRIGKYDSSKEPVPKEISDEKISELLNFYCDRAIMPSEELKAFVNRGFITREEERHNENIKATWIAIGISIFIALTSVVFNFISIVFKLISIYCV